MDSFFAVMKSTCTWFVRMQLVAGRYDPDFQPADLCKAHQQLDKVVDAAFRGEEAMRQ